MTWHDFFNFSTMAHRHLVGSYMIVWSIQGGYFAWVVWNWRRAKDLHR